jgi:hypothetical protein
VAEFLGEGIANGEPAIVVAKPSNWAATLEYLEDRGVRVRRALDEGMLVVRDAEDTLRRICRHEVPDATAFEHVVGKAVAGLSSRGGRIRAYGEMVDILAQNAELADAIKLETLWNKLAERTPFFLLCGYSAAHFVATSTHRALREICAAHSSVQRHAQDPLATWLLNSAHDTPGSASITH